MTIIRQAYHKKYVSIDNRLAQNNNLSLKARGLMLYLLSLPNDWKVILNHLCKVMKEGSDAIEGAFRELKAAGYVHHQKMGFKEGWQYFVFEEPTDKNEFKEFLRTNQVSQQLGKPNCSDFPPPLQKTHSNTKNTSIYPPPPSSKTKIKPPTEEEEKEIQRRYRERPKDADPIVSRKRWENEVLKDIRSQGLSSERDKENFETHKKQAHSYDMQKINGATVYACNEYVEFTNGSYCRQVKYNVPDDEWKKMTGWI